MRGGTACPQGPDPAPSCSVRKTLRDPPGVTHYLLVLNAGWNPDAKSQLGPQVPSRASIWGISAGAEVGGGAPRLP